MGFKRKGVAISASQIIRFKEIGMGVGEGVFGAGTQRVLSGKVIGGRHRPAGVAVGLTESFRLPVTAENASPRMEFVGFRHVDLWGRYVGVGPMNKREELLSQKRGNNNVVDSLGFAAIYNSPVLYGSGFYLPSLEKPFPTFANRTCRSRSHLAVTNFNTGAWRKKLLAGWVGWGGLGGGEGVKC
ncbi:hypothetical protein Salat_0788100 [Sesamum alatum]|uniref:Uncharacterized protein n=1 Tax=Sesamum alatum TaxID=300844 RepID=A0AAE1YTN2_9LAMI|nr:hypothetical protein Salat_0788100 [Sesamum alatum]